MSRQIIVISSFIILLIVVAVVVYFTLFYCPDGKIKNGDCDNQCILNCNKNERYLCDIGICCPKTNIYKDKNGIEQCCDKLPTNCNHVLGCFNICNPGQDLICQTNECCDKDHIFPDPNNKNQTICCKDNQVCKNKDGIGMCCQDDTYCDMKNGLCIKCDNWCVDKCCKDPNTICIGNTCCPKDKIDKDGNCCDDLNKVLDKDKNCIKKLVPTNIYQGSSKLNYLHKYDMVNIASPQSQNDYLINLDGQSFRFTKSILDFKNIVFNISNDIIFSHISLFITGTNPDASSLQGGNGYSINTNSLDLSKSYYVVCYWTSDTIGHADVHIDLIP